MRGRYAVRIETQSIMGAMMTAKMGAAPIPPHVVYRYYRWRWMAKLCAFLDNTGPVILGYVTRATVLGRIRLKTPMERLSAMDRQWHEANCTYSWSRLSSPDARNTLVQSRDRRNMASRVLPASADIQAQGQSGERE